MTPHDLADAYLAALAAADLDAVCDLFAPDGVVLSPVYGERPARAFYTALFEDTQRSEVALKRVFTDVDGAGHLALHFAYTWTLADGAVVTFDVVDLIERDDDGKIVRLTILYDASATRPAVAKLTRSDGSSAPRG